MTTLTLVWGNPRRYDEFIAFRKRVHSDGSEALISAGREFVEVELGPVPVSGPVIHFAEAPDDAERVVIALVDQSIPEWVASGTPTDWGWEPVTGLPHPLRYPFQVDLLVLSMNWSGALDGWSSSQWCDEAFRPMQRVSLPVAPQLDDLLDVRILEVGKDAHGVGYVVAFAPDRTSVDESNLASHGWRREPWVRIRRQSWSDLADLADCVEVEVLHALGTPIISQAVIHDVERLNADVFYLLPVDVREAMEEALRALPDTCGS